MNRILCITLASALMLLEPTANADVRKDRIVLADNHPTEYVVVKGDTLWDIASRFLKSPWKWPEVWSVNPQVQNPNLIYPGDVLYLTWVDGQPRITMKRGVRKLSPHARVTPLAQAIPAIPLRDIAAFLTDNIVVDQDSLQNAPYVLASNNERIISGAGDRVYARGERPKRADLMNIYRPARQYVDPETEELLGYELYQVASAKMNGYDVSSQVLTLDLTKTNEEVRRQDRVIPAPEGRVDSIYYPSAGPEIDNAVILNVLGGVAKIGQYDAIAVNVGARENVQVGNVFAISKRGETVKDPVTGEEVNLPAERAGEVMIFKVFDKVSYGLVMKATNVLAVGDHLQAP